MTPARPPPTTICLTNYFIRSISLVPLNSDNNVLLRPVTRGQQQIRPWMARDGRIELFWRGDYDKKMMIKSSKFRSCLEDLFLQQKCPSKSTAVHLSCRCCLPLHQRKKGNRYHRRQYYYYYYQSPSERESHLQNCD